jgi:hypothetical protein
MAKNVEKTVQKTAYVALSLFALFRQGVYQ